VRIRKTRQEHGGRWSPRAQFSLGNSSPEGRGEGGCPGPFPMLNHINPRLTPIVGTEKESTGQPKLEGCSRREKQTYLAGRVSWTPQFLNAGSCTKPNCLQRLFHRIAILFPSPNSIHSNSFQQASFLLLWFPYSTNSVTGVVSSRPDEAGAPRRAKLQGPSNWATNLGQRRLMAAGCWPPVTT